MDARLLEHAAEFCKLVAKADLLDYLGLTPQSTPEEVREALTRRRRYMQGMQSNPKYATEARAFIKTFGEFQTLLQDPAAYGGAAARRRESTHLPVLELTIRSALRGGPPTAEQIAFLKRNASELGVGEETFVDVLDRLSRDAGVNIRDLLEPQQPPRPPARRLPSGPEPTESTDRKPLDGMDHYRVLGVARDANDAVITATFQQRAQQARDRGDGAYLARIETAFRILSDPQQRRLYDASRTTTGPPARDRESTDPRAQDRPSPTAPPVRARSASPGRRDETPRLAFAGEPIRTLVAATPVQLDVEVLADPDDATAPGLTSDQPWVTIQGALAGNTRAQTIRLRIDVPAIPRAQGRAQVVLTNDRGERAVLILDATCPPRSRIGWFAAAGGGLVFLIGAATLVTVILRAEQVLPLHILVDPVADHVWLDGRDLGPGRSFVVPRPPKSVSLTIETSGFKKYGGITSVMGPQLVRLELTRPLDFVPGPEATRGTIPDRAANHVMAPRRDGINRCLGIQRSALSGTLRIYIDAAGRPSGAILEGGGADNPEILNCVRREAAVAVFPAVTGGDYATVRYDYSVSPGSP